MQFFSVTLRKFGSKPYRRGRDMAGQVRKLMKYQSDILSESNSIALSEGLASFQDVLEDRQREAEIPEAMNQLEDVANNNFKHYAHPIARENFEVFLVAIAVALSIRSFFIQPFRIPTGSMQPTLYGNEEYNLKGQSDEDVPGFFPRMYDFVMKGTSYYELKAKTDGKLESVSPIKTVIPFVLKKRDFRIGGVNHTLWNPPPVLKNSGRPDTDYLLETGDIRIDQVYNEGEHVVKFKVVRGDFLFVDRVSYNFRSPKRGEIIVFKTEGIKGLPGPGQFYIKRLIALGEEEVRIGNDRHVYINGTKLTKDDPGFENVYSFDPSKRPRDSRFSGHANGQILQLAGRRFFGSYGIFPNENATFTLRPNHVMVMGDNTMNSMDSRTFGDFPESNVIGKFSFACWPFLRDKPED